MPVAEAQEVRMTPNRYPDRPVVRCHACGQPGWWLCFEWDDHTYLGSRVEHLDGTSCVSSLLLEFLHPPRKG